MGDWRNYDEDEIKRVEATEAARRAHPHLPVIARLDGRAFHTYTRGCVRPYDDRLSSCMRETTARLVDEFQAALGYTQSDEITLVWRTPTLFDGRFKKLTSVLAGFASVVFARAADRLMPEKREAVPHFDCRVWQVGTLDDVLAVLAWREDDATKNSVTMAAHAHYSHRELHGKGTSEKHELLHAKGVNWNDFPAHFKRGVYFQRRPYLRELTAEELARIPEEHRPTGPIVRARVEQLDLPPVKRLEDPLAVLFPTDEGAA